MEPGVGGFILSLMVCAVWFFYGLWINKPWRRKPVEATPEDTKLNSVKAWYLDATDASVIELEQKIEAALDPSVQPPRPLDPRREFVKRLNHTQRRAVYGVTIMTPEQHYEEKLWNEDEGFAMEAVLK